LSDTIWLPAVEAARVTIRPLIETDLDAVCALMIDVGWADPALSAAEHRKQRRTWLDWTIAGYREFSRLRQPQYGERAVVRRDDGAFLGMVGMVPCLAPFGQLPSGGSLAAAPANAEVGLFWAFSPPHQGQGYASEAAAAFVASLFERHRMTRLVATTEYDNPRSIGVMRRIGMRIEKNPYPDPLYLQVVGVLDHP
jgi:RimJ/RimL family protein N-acetyltransferase